MDVVHARILAEPVVASVMAMITSGNAADGDIACARLPENDGTLMLEDEKNYREAACHASAVSCAWYELRTSGPDST